MSTSEIAKLETRWRENPQGLTFAPLAEAYRKMKEPQRALDILADGLAQHPDYIPASIVLGRCQLDLAADAEAECAFTRVLELDAENVIALKAVADICERQLRFVDAEQHLEALLLIDRSNDEARGQLERVQTSRRNSEGVVRDEDSTATDPAAEADAGVSAADTARATEGPAWMPAAADVDDEPSAYRATPCSPSVESSAEPPEPAPFEPIAFERAETGSGFDDAVVDVVSDDGADDWGSDDVVNPPEGLDTAEFALPEDAGAMPELLTGFEPVVSAIEEPDPLELHSSGASEFQLGSAADELALPSFGAGAGGAEFQAPDAAADLAGSYDFSTEDEPLQASMHAELAPDSADEPAPAPAPAMDDAPAEPAAAAAADDLAGADEPSGEMIVAGAAWEREEEPVDDRWARSDESSWGSEVEMAPDSADADVGAGFDDELAKTMAAPGGAEPEAAGVADAHEGLVVTESMAGIYLRQGHLTEALTIYRELYQRSPDNLRLREKVDELETAEAAQESGEVEPVAYSAQATGGQPVSSLFRRVLAARPAPVALWAPPGVSTPVTGSAREASRSGEPTRPADDRLSLSAVFGDDSSPVPPAVRAAEDQASDGMSFDAFFDAPSPDDPGGRRSAARGDDDLDQFHAWLQNLKR